MSPARVNTALVPACTCTLVINTPETSWRVVEGGGVDHGKSTLAKGSVWHYVTANGVRDGLVVGVSGR